MPETPGELPPEGSHGETGQSGEHFGITKTPATPAENTEEDQ